MNTGNLKLMYNHMLNVPEEQIHMKTWRKGNRKKKANLKQHECNTCGCVIGHCVVLDKWENIPKNPDGSIDFCEWSIQFTGLPYIGYRWEFMFGSKWSNDKDQILARMKYVIENGSTPPIDWEDYDLVFTDTDPQYLEKIPYEI